MVFFVVWWGFMVVSLALLLEWIIHHFSEYLLAPEPALYESTMNVTAYQFLVGCLSKSTALLRRNDAPCSQKKFG